MGSTPCFESLEPRCLLSGVTLVTHGYQWTGNTPGWLAEMASGIAARVSPNASERSLERWFLDDWSGDVRKVNGTPLVDPLQTSTGERVISLDWSTISNDAGGSAFEVALEAWIELIFPYDGATLAELPIHLIGHSRGGSVVSELTWALGSSGIWVDQLTALDAYPSQYLHSDPNWKLTDNVLFADGYFTDEPSYILNDIHGVPRAGAANFEVTGLGLSHVEVPRYYFGTVSLAATWFDGESVNNWWYGEPGLGPRTALGYNLSRVGAGEDVWSRRLSADFGRGLLPAFGGTATGRTAVLPIGDQWPNVARVQFRQDANVTAGYPLDVDFIFGDRDSTSNIRLFIDLDDNPYNGNSSEVASAALAQANMATSSLRINTTGINPGQYRVYAQITDGARTRYAYADEVLVLSAQASTGDYRLYFPEGYRSSTVNEYIPLTNPNSFPVTYQIIARYEIGDRDQVIATGVLAPTSRGGITTSEAIKPESALVRADVPYAIEIRSNGRIGAMMSHYDFGGATGEAFTNQTSATWTFPDVTKASGSVLDFLVWYNPTPTDALVTVRAVYDNGFVITRDYMVLGGYRRGGLNVDGEAWLPAGRFAATVTTSVPIVAALSHYEPGSGLAAISLGDPATLLPAAVIPWTDSTSDNEVVLFSHRAEPMDVHVVIRSDDNAQSQTRIVPLPAFGVVRLDRSWLNLPSGKRGVIYFQSTTGFSASVVSREPARGDALGVLAQNKAHTQWLFADGYMANASAGTLHTEYITLYNGTTGVAAVDVQYYLLDGTSRTRTIYVATYSTATIKVHEESEILNFAAAHEGQTWFSVGIYAPASIVATMTHWDLAQGGGWVTAGTFFDL
jgi:hypothetical protein